MEDLEEERRKIANEVMRSQNVPIMGEYTIDVIYTPPREAIEKLFDNCDAYIGVFHKKWGFVPEKNNPEKLSVTAIEYEKAKKKKHSQAYIDFKLRKRKRTQRFHPKDFQFGGWSLEG